MAVQADIENKNLKYFCSIEEGFADFNDLWLIRFKSIEITETRIQK